LSWSIAVASFFLFFSATPLCRWISFFEMVQRVAQRLLLAPDALLRLASGSSQLRVERLGLSLERVEPGVDRFPDLLYPSCH
jgi:hypothetical protein